MAHTFMKKNLLKHVYHRCDEPSDPYDEVFSVKAHFDENSSDISSAETLLTKTERPYRFHLGHGGFFAFNIAFFCFSAILFFFGGQEYMRSKDVFNNSLLRKTSEHSPIFDQIHIPLVEARRNGSFIDPPHPSIYRQSPSPEVDAAWERLANINTIPMTSEDVRRRGVDPLTTAKYPPSFGFGDDAHIGRLDVFHQIHCLDNLRKEIYFDHYYGGKFINNVPTLSHRSHVSHCLEIILQALTCSASVDPILHYWVDIQEMPFPNFNDRHKCRDFDAILKWQEEHSVDMRYFKSTVKRPDNVQVHHMSEAYMYALSLNQIASNKPEIA